MSSGGPVVQPSESWTVGLRVQLVRVGNGLGDLWGWLAAPATDLIRVPAAIAWSRKTGLRPYVLFGARYRQSSAGLRACHRLVHELNEHGMRAFSVGTVNRRWNERRISRTGFRALNHYCDPVAVYPEIVSGNPLHARYVARWALNVPGLLGGDAAYACDELVYTWAAEYYDTERVLVVDIVERDLFNDVDSPVKDADVVYLGKATEQIGDVSELIRDKVMITRRWPVTRAELASLLRRTRVLYILDNRTALTWEAILCGSRVIILPERREITAADIEEYESVDLRELQLERFIDETQAHPWPAGADATIAGDSAGVDS